MHPVRVYTPCSTSFSFDVCQVLAENSLPVLFSCVLLLLVYYTHSQLTKLIHYHVHAHEVCTHYYILARDGLAL